jgi:hypothetical protein
MTSRIAPCPVCSKSLAVRPAEGRKSGKPFIMLVCPEDGRHFRGFITDKNYVDRVHTRLKDLHPKDSSK